MIRSLVLLSVFVTGVAAEDKAATAEELRTAAGTYTDELDTIQEAIDAAAKWTEDGEGAAVAWKQLEGSPSLAKAKEDAEKKAKNDKENAAKTFLDATNLYKTDGKLIHGKDSKEILDEAQRILTTITIVSVGKLAKTVHASTGTFEAGTTGKANLDAMKKKFKEQFKAPEGKEEETAKAEREMYLDMVSQLFVDATKVIKDDADALKAAATEQKAAQYIVDQMLLTAVVEGKVHAAFKKHPDMTEEGWHAKMKKAIGFSEGGCSVLAISLIVVAGVAVVAGAVGAYVWWADEETSDESFADKGAVRVDTEGVADSGNAWLTPVLILSVLVIMAVGFFLSQKTHRLQGDHEDSDEEK